MMLISCGAANQVAETQRQVYTSFSDFRKYSEEGFLISPSPYTYNFESVGELEMTIYPAIEKKEHKYTYSQDTYYRFEKETVDYNELVAMAVTEAKSKGADAIVNFAITVEYKTISYSAYGYISGPMPTEIVKYIVKGFCIKRK